MNQNKNQIYSLLALLMWTLSAIFYFYEYLLQVSPAVMITELMRDFSVHATKLGYLTSAYFYAYAIMQIPVGILIDRFGAKRLLTMASFICAAGCLLFSASSTFYIAVIGRTLIGFGSAFAVVGCLSLAAHWFSPKRFALLTGIMLTIGMTGAICGVTLIAFILKYFSWRSTIFGFSGFGAVLGLLFLFILKDGDRNANHQNTDKAARSLLTGLKHVIYHKQTWFTAVYGGLMFAPTSIFGSVWGIEFLITSHHLTKPVAALLTSCIFLGWAIGSPFTGWLSDAIRRRKVIMMTGSIGALLCMSSIIYIPNMPKLLLAILLFAFGLFSSGFFLSFAIVREINPKKHSGTVLGFMNMMNMIGGMFGPPLIGFILDYYWSGAIKDGSPIYSHHVYQAALTALPVMIFIALCILPFVKETYCVPINEDITD